MTTYGKTCKEDNDCYSKICEMTYKDKKPDTRRCVTKNNIEKVGKKKTLEFGKKCNTDTDCDSYICEHKYNTDTQGYRNDKGTFCVIQELKWGTKCDSNSECDSYRCYTKYDENNIPDERRCIIFDNQPDIKNKTRSFGDIEDKDLPDFAKDPAWKSAKDEELFLSNKEKAKKLEGRGIISDIIILLMEVVVIIIKSIIKLFVDVWKLIFLVISYLPTQILKMKIFWFSEKYKCKDSSKCSTDSCDPKRAFTIKASHLKKLMVILFPPYGIFLIKGISAIQHILISCILTMMFYFPGMIYGLYIIEDET